MSSENPDIADDAFSWEKEEIKKSIASGQEEIKLENLVSSWRELQNELTALEDTFDASETSGLHLAIRSIRGQMGKIFAEDVEQTALQTEEEITTGQMRGIHAFVLESKELVSELKQLEQQLAQKEELNEDETIKLQDQAHVMRLKITEHGDAMKKLLALDPGSTTGFMKKRTLH